MTGIVGTTLAKRYRVDEMIGRGGMAEVYRGHDLTLDRAVAIKVLTERSETVTETLLREARSMARLNHANIVAVYDAGHDGSIAFIVMELVGGRTLDTVPASELTLRGAVSWFAELLDALAYAHENGVLHRDIKPANVMVLSDRLVKMMDFGLSKRATELSNETTAGEIVGTIAYLAPERFLGRVADERSDLYSVGCVMYEVFTGRPPFRTETDDVVAVIYAHVNDEPVPPRRINASVPLEIERIILKLLEKEPERRYAKAREVAAELRGLLGAPAPAGRGEPARPTPPTGGSIPAKPVKSPSQQSTDPDVRAVIDAAFNRTQRVQDASGSALAGMLAERKGDWAEAARAYRQAVKSFKAAGNDVEWTKVSLKFASLILQKVKETPEPGKSERRDIEEAVAVLQEALPAIRGRMIRSELEEAERLLYMLQRAGASSL